MAGNLNILVLSDNEEILARARPIFETRKASHWTFTNSDDINPKKDHAHIIKTYGLVFSLHCKKIFPKVLTDSVRCVNVHPGLNPYNRGVFPHVFSIVNGLPAGATIHEMTDKIDGGPIIVSDQVEVLLCDTSTSLYKRVINKELELLDLCLDKVVTNDYETFPINWEGNYNSMSDFERLCKLNREKVAPFGEYFDILRALSHTGYMNARMNGIKFKLIIDENQEPS